MQDMIQLLGGVAALEDQPPVYCQECGEWWQVEPALGRRAWLCPGCGRKAVYAVQPGRCRRCSQPCQVIRYGHDTSRTMCRCHWTPEQVRAAERDARYSREREAREEAEAAYQRALGAQRADASRQAVQCYEERARRCVEPRNALPHNFCGNCPRFA